MSESALTRRDMLAASAIAAMALPGVTLAMPRETRRTRGTMRAAVIQKGGEPVAPNVKLVEDWPAPEAGPGEAVVRTLAAALNRLDIWVGTGLGDQPWVSGSDACGIVESVGEGVDESWLGLKVILNAAVEIETPPRPDGRTLHPPKIKLIGSSTNGTMAELFVVPVANLIDVKDADPVEAAAFALTHITAWRMLTTRAQLKPDDLLLLTGIGGGVSQACLSIASTIGCETIVTSRHQSKLDRASKRGAHHVILDRGQNWDEEVQDLTSQYGVDVCADSVGQVLHAKCMRSLAQGGTLVTCGATTGKSAMTDIGIIYWKQTSILGSSMGSMDEFRAVTRLFTEGLIKPIVDSVFKADDVAEAYAKLESGEQYGKVVVDWR